jgi:hypothetical protein
MRKIPNASVLVNLRNGQPVSIIHNGYKIISNDAALALGEECFKMVFETADVNDLEVFNILTPITKSYCHIDLIHKNYELNLWKKEVYLPYLRVTNSYNGTRALSFRIGFCRKLCSNGVIFEKSTILYTYRHTKGEIGETILFDNQKGKFRELEEGFQNYIHKLTEIEVPKKYSVMVLFKGLDLKFNLQSKDPVKSEKAKMKFDQFRKRAVDLSDRYYAELGENAYAVFNIMTEYASDPQIDNGDMNRVNGFQRRAGKWAEDFSQWMRTTDFNLEGYVQDVAYLFVD